MGLLYQTSGCGVKNFVDCGGDRENGEALFLECSPVGRGREIVAMKQKESDGRDT